MERQRAIVVGGGAAGIFAAIACAEAAPQAEVTVLEKSPRFLSKVRISGGGRCNVTHHCFEPRELATCFPRGAQELIGAFQRFQARDTVRWFESRGVKLKTEKDGRMFPVTDSSETIIDCLMQAAWATGVTMLPNKGLEAVLKHNDGSFLLRASQGGERVCDQLLLATGGCRTPSAGHLASSLGHTLETPVPSLFTFHIEEPWLRELAGVSVEVVEASVTNARLRERGALLVTHSGLSGPAILRLSAWGARKLAGSNYEFPLRINWLPDLNTETIAAELEARRKTQAARLVVNAPLSPLPSRLWEALLKAAALSPETRWAALSRPAQHRLIQHTTQPA